MGNLPTPDRHEAYRRATDRIRARLGFFVHAGIFGAIGLLLLVLNLVTTPGAWWFFWPLLFWGIALTAHGATLYGPGFRALERWRDRELARELERLRGSGQDAAEGPPDA